MTLNVLVIAIYDEVKSSINSMNPQVNEEYILCFHKNETKTLSDEIAVPSRKCSQMRQCHLELDLQQQFCYIFQLR